MIIIDIDGICMDATARIGRCTNSNGQIDWRKVFSNAEVIQDPPLEGAVEAVKKIYKKMPFIYLTSRSQECFQATAESLEKHGFPNQYVFMRPPGDKRPDHEVKSELLFGLKLAGYDEFFAAIDDDHTGNLEAMYKKWEIPMFESFEEFFASDVWEYIEKNY